jgi:hypothetical protein
VLRVGLDVRFAAIERIAVAVHHPARARTHAAQAAFALRAIDTAGATIEAIA